MNNKQLLIALFATAFSGITFATATVTINSTTAVTFLTDAQQAYCHEKNTNACKALSAFTVLMQDATTINPTSPEGEELAALLNSLNEEINGKVNTTNILEAAANVTEEVAQNLCTALMVIPQPQVVVPHEQK